MGIIPDLFHIFAAQYDLGPGAGDDLEALRELQGEYEEFFSIYHPWLTPRCLKGPAVNCPTERLTFCNPSCTMLAL